LKNNLPAYLFVFGIWLMAVSQIFIAIESKNISRQNQAYLITMNCFGAHTSKPVGEREPGYVKECVQYAEGKTGVTIEHFGDAK